MTLKPREAPQIRELAVRQGLQGRPARPSLEHVVVGDIVVLVP